MTVDRLAYYGPQTPLPAALLAKLDALPESRYLVAGPSGSVGIARMGRYEWAAAVIYGDGSTDLLRVTTVDEQGPSLADILAGLHVIGAPEGHDSPATHTA